MHSLHPRSRIVPAFLGIAMFTVTMAAAFLPGIGASPAPSGAACVYGECPSNNSGIPLGTLYLILGLLAIVALVLGLLIYRERRRGGRQPPHEWSETSGGPAPKGAGASAYTEGPDDVSVPPPDVSPAIAGAAVGAGAVAGQEGDIDSLMAELDRISGEILKKGSGKKGGPGSSNSSDASKEEDR